MELHGDGLATLAHQAELGSDVAALHGTLADMVQESLLISFRHIIRKGMTRQRVALCAKHPGSGEVDLLDVPVLIQGGIAQRGEVV